MIKENLLCVAQCEQDKKWYMGYPFHNVITNQWFVYTGADVLPVPVLEYTICRCIDRKDAFGDLIFEGCMLKVELSHCGRFVQGIVKWDNYVGGWGLMVKGKMGVYELRYRNPEELTIVGHIHTDQGLLRSWGYQDDGTWDETLAPIIGKEDEVKNG